MKLATIIAMLLLLTLAAYAQPEVQISAERDAKGKFINEAALSVTWETEADGTTLKEYQDADVPDHVPEDDDSLQEWYVPKPQSSVYWKFSFTRTVKGEYGLRWRVDSEGLWSEWSACTITKVKPPKHGD